MPTTPYAKALVSLNGGGLVGGGQTVTATHTVQLQGENTSGWRKSRWEIIGPPGWAVPAGWTDEDGVAVYVGVTGNPPLWTLPAITAFGKWIVTLIVNDGEKDGDAAHVDMRDSTLALSMVSANGLEDIGTGEGTQFDDVRSWTGALQAMVRQVDTALGLISGTSEQVTLTGTVAIGDVVCSANDAATATKVALATAANLANGGAAGIRVMLEAGTVGQNKSAAGPGDIIAPSVLGLVAGATTDTVIINTTTGRASRVATTAVLASDWVLGHCDKQGNTTIDPRAPGTVSEPTATVSTILAADGNRFRARRDVYNFADFKVSGAYPDETGVVAVDAHVRLAFSTMASRTKLWVPKPSAFYRLEWSGSSVDGPLKVYNDDSGGNKRGFHIVGEGPGAANTAEYHFRIASKIKRGTAASVTARTNGGPLTFTADDTTEIISYVGLDMPTGTRVSLSTTGTLPAPLLGGATVYYTIRQSSTSSKLATTLANALAGTAVNITTTGTGTQTLDPGDYHQTITVDVAAGITAANKARWIGRPFSSYGAATDGNKCDGAMIVDVPADNTLRVSNRNDTAAATDANNGSISWWIDEPVFDFRAADMRMEGIAFGMVAAGDIGCFVELNHPPGPGQRAVTRCQIVHNTFGSDAQSSGYYRDCLRLAQNIVCTDLTYFDHRGKNGLGEWQWSHPTQVSETIIHANAFVATASIVARSAIALWSGSAQSKNNHITQCTFVRQQFGVCVPNDLRLGGVWTSTGLAHFDLASCQSQQNFDAIVQAGGYASDIIRIDNLYGENVARVFKGLNTGASPVCLTNPYIISSTTAEHPSGAWIDTNAPNLTINGGSIDYGNGSVPHITHRGTQTNREVIIAIRDFTIQGTTNYSVEFGLGIALNRGPYDFGAGGQKLGFKVDGGAQVDVTFSQANFDAVMGYTVNLRRVHTWEVAKMIQNYVAGAKSWGDGDDIWVYVRSATNTTGGSIRVEAPLSGVSANTILGFGLAATSTNRAQTRLAKDSANLADWGFSTGTSGKVWLIMEAVRRLNKSTNAQDVINNVNKRINSGTLGGLQLDNVVSLNGPNANSISCKNFNGTQAFANGDTTKTIAFATAEEDTNFDVAAVTILKTAGTPAVAAYRWHIENKTVNGFDLVVEASPGSGGDATATTKATWMITR